ncbi:hypothetical protein ACFV6E_11905 [Streptomyces sp. NPDC059785]|uniref:hypothetical protein n=1 Tax=unclassified Streptomyces TaxID=2593676 RepID=UPI00365FE48E
MNGNPLYYWVMLVVSTVLVLPMVAALLTGKTPLRMRKRQAGMRLRAYGFLCWYALVPLNGVPRIAGASYETVMACTGVSFGFLVAAAVLLLLAERRDAARRASGGQAGTVEAREA